MSEDRPLGEIIDEKTNKALELDFGNSIEVYADALQVSEDELVALIKNKKVLDLGSSRGLFAKECALRNIPTLIYSVSPRLALETFRDSERDLTQELSKNKQEIKRIQKTHDATAMSTFAQELPFAPESVDVILDVFSVFNYADLANFAIAVQEEYRALKQGGEIRMVSAALTDDFINFRKIKLKELKIPFEEIKKEAGTTLGFRIVKPIHKDSAPSR
jgi:SAM-dependent methyltransferase